MEDVVIDSTIVATANNRNQINMYAVWVPALKDGSNNTVYFQDWDNPNTTLPNDGCSTLTQTVFDDTITNEKGKITVAKDSFVALTDKRDNEVYTVARLADGNCWMTENLRLEHEGTVGNNINDPTVTNQSLSQGYGGTTGTYGNFVGLAASESANFTDSTTSNSIYKSDDSEDVFNTSTNTLEDIGTSNYPAYRFPRYNNSNNSSALSSPTYTENYTNAASPSSSGTYKYSTVSSYGNYYTWAAAMANTNYYSTTSASESAGTSICPSGWHLPSSGDTSKEYGVLSQHYGGNGQNQSGAGTGDIMSNRFRSFPNSFLHSGYYDNQSANTRGLGGSYWSSSVYGGGSSYNLGSNSTGLYPSNGNTKYIGFSVRCLMRPSDVEIILDSNNGTNAVSRVYGAAGSTITLPSSSNPSAAIAKPGYVFNNWNTTPDGSGTSYTSSFTIPAGSTSETLYAQWTPQYTITYVNNCQTYASANSSCTQTVSDSTDSQKINLTNDPSTGAETDTLAAYNNWTTLTGWKIVSWNTSADGTGTGYPVSGTYTVPSGSRGGDGITLYAHWAQVYSIQYDGNGSDNDSTGMESTDASTGIKSVAHTNVGEGDTFDLFVSNFKRAGYGFVGWSTDSDAWNKLVDNDTTNDAKIWGPNEIITAPAYNGTPITTLYAIWAPAETNGGNPVYLQGWTGCSAMTATTYDTASGKLNVARNSITALTDQRDGNVYAVAKLADENCWMVENLRLDNTSELSTTNTNIKTNNSTLPITNVYNADSSLAIKSNFLSATSNSWCTSDSAACNDRSLLNTTNTVANTIPSQIHNITSPDDHVDFDETAYGYGNYYNWYSATAGYGTHSRITGEPTAGDLCPADWKLPYGGIGTSGTYIGGTKGGFSYLDKQMGGTGEAQFTSESSNRWRKFPNNFNYSGYWSYDLAGFRGNYGSYWSSSALDSFNASYLTFNSTFISPGVVNSYKYNGNSIRCVFNDAGVAGKLNVTYDANGLLFANGETTNLVKYDATATTTTGTVTKKSYANAYNEEGGYSTITIGAPVGNRVVTIDGAESIHIAVTYGVPQNNGGPQSDLYIFSGNHPEYTNADSSSAIQTCGTASATNGAYSTTGSAGTQVTMECDIASDSVTFYDYSSGTSNQYSVGYYAVITGQGTITSYNKTVTSGTYQTPSTRAGQDVFLGWSTNPNANANAEEPLYTNEADFIANAPYLNIDGTVIMYAVWGKTFNAAYADANKSQLSGHYKMQDGTEDICKEIYVGATETLIDSRDNTTYMAGRLKDGKCWMLDNLALDPTNSTTASNMNASNTNATQEAITNLLNGGSSTTGWSNTAVADVDTNFYDGGYTVPRINNASKDTLVTSYGPASTGGQAKVGIYYNYCAASASTYCYAYGQGVDVPDTIIDAPQDICPANWRMPTDGQYLALAQKYTNTATDDNSLQYNLSTPLSGYYNGSSANNQGSYGYWWSSTYRDSTNMYSLYVGPTYVDPYYSFGRGYGRSMRCLVSE